MESDKENMIIDDDDDDDDGDGGDDDEDVGENVYHSDASNFGDRVAQHVARCVNTVSYIIHRCECMVSAVYIYV